MMNYVIIALYCGAIFVNGMNASLDFKNGRTGCGIIYCATAVLWTVCLCLRMV